MAHEYTIQVAWERGDDMFTDNRYSRGHRLIFDGGIEVPGSSSPGVVPLPMSIEAAVDPEEAFIASISSCHMLWFLSIAAKRGYRIDDYRDRAVGVMEKNAEGKTAITRVTLRPAVTFSGANMPDSATVASMHERAHEECFIANSVKTAITVEPPQPDGEER